MTRGPKKDRKRQKSKPLSNQEPKRAHKAKNRTNSTKEFSERFEGVAGHLPSETRVLRQIAPKSLSHSFFVVQRRRDDNKNKICAFEGGGPWGQRGKSSKNAAFRGKRHDNRILKVQILLSRNFVVIAQAPCGAFSVPHLMFHRHSAKIICRGGHAKMSGSIRPNFDLVLTNLTYVDSAKTWCIAKKRLFISCTQGAFQIAPWRSLSTGVFLLNLKVFSVEILQKEGKD